MRAPRARETRCDVRILPATEHCCQRAEFRRNEANVDEGGRPLPSRLRVGHDFARFQWFSRGSRRAIPRYGAATGAAWKFIERAWTRNGAFTVRADPRIDQRTHPGYRVSPTSRLEISKRNVATAAFFQQYRKLLDLVTLFSPPPPPLARTCRRSRYRSFDRASHIRRISSFVLPRGSLILSTSPCITTLISHDFQLERYFSRAKRAKETSRDPQPYLIFYLGT